MLSLWVIRQRLHMDKLKLSKKVKKMKIKLISNTVDSRYLELAYLE